MRTLLATTIAQYIQDNASLEKLLLPNQRVLKDVHAEKANSVRCERTLTILTELLTIQNEAKPWVLIDEYDYPDANRLPVWILQRNAKSDAGLLSTASKTIVTCIAV